MWIFEIYISKYETSNQDPNHTSKCNEIERMVSENDTNKDSNESGNYAIYIDYTVYQ